MQKHSTGSLVVSALLGSLVTFVMVNAMRSSARTDIITTDGFIMPKPPFDRVIRRLDFQDVPFRDAIRALSEKTGVSINLQTKALADAGVKLDAPITLNLANATIAQALDAIFDNLAPRNGVTYWYGDKSVEVGTPVEEEQKTTSRVYDVRDLLEKLAADDKALYGEAMESDAICTSLMTLIQDGIAVDKWQDNGGNVGSTCCVFGRLVVTQTSRSHDQIASLLFALSNRGTHSVAGSYTASH